MKPKSTAEGVAALRAAGALESDPVLRNPDSVAGKLLGLKFKLLVGIPPLRKMMVKTVNRKLPGTYHFHVARTKHIDAALRAAAGEGTGQVVILGAGFDTRAIRFRELLAGVPVFEVDFPGTQALKQRRVRGLLERQSNAVRFVPVDFNTDDLEERLVTNGYDTSKKTFFIWEGVSMYISSEANDQIFAFVRNSSPTGSFLIFEYVFQSLIDGSSTHYGAQESRAYVAARGEPYVFGIPEGTAGDFLKERGLELVSDFTGARLEQEYLSDESGNAHGKVHAYSSVALCRVA